MKTTLIAATFVVLASGCMAGGGWSDPAVSDIGADSVKVEASVGGDGRNGPDAATSAKARTLAGAICQRRGYSRAIHVSSVSQCVRPSGMVCYRTRREALYLCEK